MQQISNSHLKHHVGPGRPPRAQSSRPRLSLSRSLRLDFHVLRAAVHCAGGMHAIIRTGLHMSCFGYLRAPVHACRMLPTALRWASSDARCGVSCGTSCAASRKSLAVEDQPPGSGRRARCHHSGARSSCSHSSCRQQFRTVCRNRSASSCEDAESVNGVRCSGDAPLTKTPTTACSVRRTTACY